MNYEKKYKEALERARKLEENSNGMILKKWLWNIFPELKESGDEKVRKEIIRFIRMEVEDEIVGNKWLAWLEKQKGNIGGISPNWSEEDEENFCSVYLDVKSARQNTVNSLSGDLKEQEEKRMDEVISWLESLKGRVQPKQEGRIRKDDSWLCR